MQFIYRLNPTRPGMLTEGPTEREAEILSDHFNYLEQLAAAGTVHLSGRTLNEDERTFGIVIFHVESESGAATIMGNDPAVKLGVMAAELFPFRIAVSADPGIQHD